MTAERVESVSAPTIADLCVVIARGDKEQSKSARETLKARLVETRETCVELAERLHQTALQGVARAEASLVEFDRESERLLAESNRGVQKARCEYETAYRPESGTSGERFYLLEEQLRQAQARDLAVLRSRGEARVQHEAAWRAEAMAAVTAGIMLANSLRIDAGLIEPSAVTIVTSDPREGLAQVGSRTTRYPSPAEPNGSTHHDAAPAETHS